MTRVLIIEDDTKTANAIREGLQLDGYDAVAVNAGAEGVAALRTSSFDALILDWMLPQYSGCVSQEPSRVTLVPFDHRRT